MAGRLTYWVLPVADEEKAAAFFGDVMGWSWSEPSGAGGRHITDSEPWGGIAATDRVSTATLAFGVDDLEATVARIRELGGTAGEPVESPQGRWVECTDDQGTRFALFDR